MLRAYLIGKRFGFKCEIVAKDPFIKINIEKSKNATLRVKGRLRFTSFFYKNQPINIVLENNATLEIDGDLEIGGETTIYVGENAYLRIGGRCNERVFGAAILGAVISVHKKITIGYDCLIVNGVSIIDSNFHYVAYNNVPVDPQADVTIGNNVWLCPDSTVLKGSVIGDGCIVGHNSVVTGKVFPEHCFVAGIPARVIKRNCEWRSSLT